ncbi:MAG: 5'-methylthioadenosine/adenosylhomocysteine nucleosidase [Candidatus Amulumruptor caecigallinarius]|nr:5'-methylthioadenosine/adenosylhomocysteine nucleosidase [Candidatus Amulumruptor caecigallinarius]
MKIAIISAMSKELNLVLKLVGDYKKREIRDGLTIYEGKLGAHNLVMMQCGIGKVNSALRTHILIEAERPELVINSGVAGSTDKSVAIGCVLVPSDVAYHDVWCGPGTMYGAADGFPRLLKTEPRVLKMLDSLREKCGCGITTGLLCSGDKFISTSDEVDEIKKNFPDALGCDMESAPIAQTCMMHATPFCMVRVMSDMPGNGDNVAQYSDFWDKAPENTFSVVAEIIKNIEF